MPSPQSADNEYRFRLEENADDLYEWLYLIHHWHVDEFYDVNNPSDPGARKAEGESIHLDG
jgi:hypothetical protein